MGQFKYEVDFQQVINTLRKVDPELKRQTVKELRDIAAEVVKEARTHMPSGVAKAKKGSGAKTGYTWRFYGGKGAVMEALGSDKTSAPKSWAGAFEGGNSGTKSFRHPLYGDRKHWYDQEPFHPLHDAWALRRDAALTRTNAAIDRALRRAGFAGGGTGGGEI